jgi:hypothetical protein
MVALRALRQGLKMPMQCAQLLFVQILDVDQAVAGSSNSRNDLVELQVDRQRILVLGPLNQNTIRKVTIVVPVLITSCQVSEKSTNGPVISQTAMMVAAKKKA